MVLSKEQCRAGRALLGWTQDRLATEAAISKKTLTDFEAGNRIPYGRTIADIWRALDAAGIQFIPENGGGVGVRLKEPKRD